MRRISRIVQPLVFLFTLALLLNAAAKDTVEITLSTGGGTATAGFSDLSDAIDSLQNPDGYYNGVVNSGDDFTGTINILGFEMNMAYSNTPPTLTYSFYDKDGNLVTQTFTGTSQEDVFHQLEEFYKSEAGQETFNKYMEALQTRALLNFVSGPQSPIGESVRKNTERAMGSTLTPTELMNGARSGGGFSIGAEYSEFSSAGYTGKSYTVPIQIGGRLGKTFSLDFYFTPNYTDIEGTSFYRLGLDLDLGIRLLGFRPGFNPVEWVISPTVGNYLAGTSDLLVGGDVYNYGVQNRLQWNSRKLSIAYGTYYGVYKSKEISLGDFDVDLNVNEKVLSQGLKAILYLGRNITLDGFIIRSRPDDGAGFYELETTGVNLNLRLSFWSKRESLLLRVGYAKDRGKDTQNSDYDNRRLSGQLIYRF